MIAVVTGSTGFIGSHLVDALLARGATVRALLRPDSPGENRNPRVEYSTADLIDDRSVRDSPVWNGATHVFHAAGVTKRRTLAEFRAGNVVPTANILSALAARSVRLDRFVLVSSQAAAGPAEAPDRPLREDDRPRPIEAYGVSKLEAEQAVLRYAGAMPVCIVRPGAVYGPRDVDFLNVFREATRPLGFYAAPRDQVLSIVYVADLVGALVLAGVRPAAVGRTFFAAHPHAATWRQIYEGVTAIAPRRSLRVQVPGPLLTVAGYAGNLAGLVTGRPFLINSNKIALSRPLWWLCDSTRMRSDLGWHPETDLQAGLRETYLWYVREGWLRAAKSASPPE